MREVTQGVSRHRGQVEQRPLPGSALIPSVTQHRLLLDGERNDKSSNRKLLKRTISNGRRPQLPAEAGAGSIIVRMINGGHQSL